MARIIAINGTRLNEVRMLLEPAGNGTISYLSYPLSQIRIVQTRSTLKLFLPAYLVVELYRSGVLPTDQGRAIRIQIDEQPAREFLIQLSSAA